jgi:hypothetical protein
MGRLHTSPTNIRLGWKDLPGTNTLAYYDTAKNIALKSFIVQTPGVNPFRCFTLGLALRLTHKRWKVLPRTNTLAYFDTAKITAVKSFIVHTPGANPFSCFTLG